MSTDFNFSTTEPRNSPLDIRLNDLSIKSRPQFQEEPPKVQRRSFVKARTLFVKPITKDGKPDFEEVMGDIELPEEYSPDTKDRFYRPPKLSEDKHVYHVIPSAAVNRDGKPVAAKRYKIGQLNQTIDGYTRLRREIQFSRCNRHENIVKRYEAFVDPENPTHIWLVTERMDQTLESYFKDFCRKDGTSDPVKRDLRILGALLTQLLRALDYIHQHGIMHGDLTPRNIGMNQKEFEIKLLDFGLASRQLDETGTDVRAVALVILELLGVQELLITGSDQIQSNAATNRIASFSKVAKDKEASILRQLTNENEFEETWRTKIESRLGPDTGILKRNDFKDLLEKMLHINSKKRPSADECLNHGFLRALNLKYEAKKDEGQKSQNQLDRDFFLQEAGNQSLFAYQPDSRTRSS